jgi:hypothetical protein
MPLGDGRSRHIISQTGSQSASALHVRIALRWSDLLASLARNPAGRTFQGIPVQAS